MFVCVGRRFFLYKRVKKPFKKKTDATFCMAGVPQETTYIIVLQCCFEHEISCEEEEKRNGT